MITSIPNNNLQQQATKDQLVESRIKPFIIKMQKEDFPLGQYPLKGDDYAIITKADLSQTDTFIEFHKKFIDVHYIISGCELIKYNCKDSLQIVKEYNEDTDSFIAQGNMDTQVILYPGDMAIIYPLEPHMTKLQPNTVMEESKVKKIIFKLEDNVFND